MELFRVDCIKCLQEYVKRILKHFPLIFILTRGISFADPLVALTPYLTMKRLSCAVDIFVNHNWLSGTVCSLTVVQGRLKLHVGTKFSLDQFWFDILNVYCCEDMDHLPSFLKIFIMSHGKAACFVENLLEISLIAQHTIHDSILSTGGLDLIITERFIRAVCNAHSNYKDYMEQ
ncbi:hypothetical protein PR048_009116 [Dryococelus australis]|uniref:Uncharacterized protein n=1 Tax=Dryococelus australis TaxID=614101 RepID=A0ABQ9HZ02_9NEOP|nr:hypothetical protein PR048_009116 [Dryococelus australis]